MCVCVYRSIYIYIYLASYLSMESFRPLQGVRSRFGGLSRLRSCECLMDGNSDDLKFGRFERAQAQVARERHA